jgi:hypothetical protein
MQDEEYATTGLEGGSGIGAQAQTTGCGLPCKSNDTQVQPVSISWTIAFQYLSDISRFRRLHVGRNCKPGSKSRSWPGEWQNGNEGSDTIDQDETHGAEDFAGLYPGQVLSKYVY